MMNVESFLVSSTSTRRGLVSVHEVRYPSEVVTYVVTLNDNNDPKSGVLHTASTVTEACAFAHGVWFALEILGNQ